MDFEWDFKKNDLNIKKHGIDFSDAVTVLYDEYALTIAEVHESEERFITIGHDGYARLLVVVYCIRDEKIRIISARKSTKKEMGKYGEGK